MNTIRCTHLLHASRSQLFYTRTLPKRLTFLVSLPLLHCNQRTAATRLVCSKMSTDSSPSPLTHTITIPSQLSQPVHVSAAPGLSESDFRCALESTLFKQWLKNLQSETGILANGDMLLKQVLIQGVDMFRKRIGFLKFKADIFYKETGRKVPGIVFARGPAVAVLILLDSEGETYAILTEQVRVPTGRVILELPAGMLDDDKSDFIGTAVREVEEEIGIHLKLEDMIDLTAFLNPSTGCRIFPSPGGCDEEISLFLFKGSVDKEIIMQLQGKETGLRDHGELIKMMVPASFRRNTQMVMRLCSQRNILSSKVLFSSFRCSFYNLASVSSLLPWFRVSNGTIKYRFCKRFYVMASDNMSIMSSDNASGRPLVRRTYQVVMAATRDMGIGKDGKLPWKLPSDLEFFKKLTVTVSDPGKKNAVVMGRKTWESIPPLYRPLPGRLNVVLTRSGSFNITSAENVVICGSIHSALELLAEAPYCLLIEKVFVIGGGQILRESLNAPECDAIHITKIENSIECDTFIPAIDLSLFQLWYSSQPLEENSIQFSFQTYVRVRETSTGTVAAAP